MAYPYSLRAFAGLERRPSLGVSVLLGGTGLVLATSLLLRASSPAPTAPTAQFAATAVLPAGIGHQLPVPASLNLLASLPATTWLPPYPATTGYARPVRAGGEAVAVGYHPLPTGATETEDAPTRHNALQRSWDTIKRMFR